MMQRRRFLQTVAAGAVAAGVLRGARAEERTEARQRIAKAMAAALSLQRKDWEQGVLAQALLEAGEREQVIRLTRGAMVQATPDGRMGVVVEGGVTDPAMGGAAYAQAARWTRDAAMQAGVERLRVWIRDKAPRSADGILYHTFGKPEMWSDGFNGAPPFLAAMGDYDEALKQIEGFRARLWDEKRQLLAHVWDDGAKKLTDARAWGGGNGWAAAGLARVIASLPHERAADRRRLAELARAIIDGCLRHERGDGLFHDVVDDDTTFVETNLAQMLAYAIYRGTHDGWLERSYRAHADRMREAARGKMDAEGFVQGVCGAPEFDRPGISTEGQAFCILMEAVGEDRAAM
ncbi:MAG: glycoside hydrolase family 88 protein [Terracidiphilus sp.]|nr:glycoside hydrolase family 88 protein [Terracidiphilus sp.]